jgi:hypothetical protein
MPPTLTDDSGKLNRAMREVWARRASEEVFLSELIAAVEQTAQMARPARPARRVQVIRRFACLLFRLSSAMRIFAARDASVISFWVFEFADSPPEVYPDMNSVRAPMRRRAIGRTALVEVA